MDGTDLRTAIITGGVGGIGQAVALRLAELGYAVVVADLNSESAERVAAGLPRPTGAGHIAFAGDLVSSATNRRLADAARDIGPIGVVVNAIGIAPKKDGSKIAFFDIDDDTWDAVMGTNLKAPFLLIREAYAHMPRDGSASIVNVLSVTSKLAAGGPMGSQFFPRLPTSAVYAASKGALQNLTASLARELVGFRIRVNGVAPGFVTTSMTQVIGEDALKGMTSQIPMERLAEPSEIADAIEFLISKKASYITGTSIDVNGGLLMC